MYEPERFKVKADLSSSTSSRWHSPNSRSHPPTVQTCYTNTWMCNCEWFINTDFILQTWNYSKCAWNIAAELFVYAIILIFFLSSNKITSLCIKQYVCSENDFWTVHFTLIIIRQLGRLDQSSLLTLCHVIVVSDVRVLSESLVGPVLCNEPVWIDSQIVDRRDQFVPMVLRSTNTMLLICESVWISKATDSLAY